MTLLTAETRSDAKGRREGGRLGDATGHGGH
jgi:hypothetical protein